MFYCYNKNCSGTRTAVFGLTVSDFSNVTLEMASLCNVSLTRTSKKAYILKYKQSQTYEISDSRLFFKKKSKYEIVTF